MEPRTPVSIFPTIPKNTQRTASPSATFTANQDSVEPLFTQLSSLRELKLKRKYREETLKLAAVEQEVYRWLVAQLQSRATDSEFCDVKVVVLKEYIRHHVRKEASAVVPAKLGRGLDIAELGKVLQNVQQNLHTELTQS
jgi:hypothetical protein